MNEFMHMNREDVLQSLLENDVPREMQETIMKLYDEGRSTELVPMLKRHRQTLLTQMHESQDKVDRFDFLVYRMVKISKREM